MRQLLVSGFDDSAVRDGPRVHRLSVAAGIVHTHHKPALDHQLDNIMPWVASVGAAAAAGDFNNDGWLDLYVTNITSAEYLQEGNMLWHNNGPGPDGKVTFTDISLETGTYDGGWGWGGRIFRLRCRRRNLVEKAIRMSS